MHTFSRIFSLKSTYVKYKKVILSHIYIYYFAHERIRQIGMYFPRCVLGSILTTCFAVVIKYLGKYLTICVILSCATQ